MQSNGRGRHRASWSVLRYECMVHCTQRRAISTRDYRPAAASHQKRNNNDRRRRSHAIEQSDLVRRGLAWQRPLFRVPSKTRDSRGQSSLKWEQSNECPLNIHRSTPFARVREHVTSQMACLSKSSITALQQTGIRSLTGVDARMSNHAT